LAARLAAAALEQAAHPVVYDRSYRRRRAEIAPSAEPADYRVGDLVTWMLPGNPPHIGIVVDRRSSDSRRPLLVHNIGNGPEVEDILFRFTTTGHYRYLPASGE
jgi:hypothetical protein